MLTNYLNTVLAVEVAAEMNDHIVIETKNQAFTCLHCKAWYQPNLPAPLSMVVAMMESFVKIHKDCKKKVSP